MKLTQDLKIFKQIVQAHICGTTFPAWHLTHSKMAFVSKQVPANQYTQDLCSGGDAILINHHTFS